MKSEVGAPCVYQDPASLEHRLVVQVSPKLWYAYHAPDHTNAVLSVQLLAADVRKLKPVPSYPPLRMAQLLLGLEKAGREIPRSVRAQLQVIVKAKSLTYDSATQHVFKSLGESDMKTTDKPTTTRVAPKAGPAAAAGKKAPAAKKAAAKATGKPAAKKAAAPKAPKAEKPEAAEKAASAEGAASRGRKSALADMKYTVVKDAEGWGKMREGTARFELQAAIKAAKNTKDVVGTTTPGGHVVTFGDVRFALATGLIAAA